MCGGTLEHAGRRVESIGLLAALYPDARCGHFQVNGDDEIEDGDTSSHEHSKITGDDHMKLNSDSLALGRSICMIKEILSTDHRENGDGKRVSQFLDEAYANFMEKLDSSSHCSSLTLWEGKDEVVDVGDNKVTQTLAPILQHPYFGLRVREKVENTAAKVDEKIVEVSTDIEELTSKLEALKLKNECVKSLESSKKSRLIEDSLEEAETLKWWLAGAGVL
ncbi:unnamed protein product [Dovyalis caffra]|uniref:Uncharacterized protein n=1 Tax=Dovyalis caffra TaxID=77055 RepID=A0AAV1RNZ3_9ROSI|nr:unnamed protein product [Dovyalis caffra]